MTKKKSESDPLSSWTALQEFLRDATDWNQVNKLLVREQTERRRRCYMRRIHQRQTKLRAIEDRAELDKMALPAKRGRPKTA